MVISLLIGLVAAFGVSANGTFANTVPTQDDPALARIQKIVVRPPVVCGAFDQQKTLVGLKRPVRSSGRFCIVSQAGVLWKTLLPFPSTLRLSREEIVQSQGETITSRLTTRDEPTVGIISDLLFSVLGGDFKRLQSGFKIEASAGAGSHWRTKLTPKESGMRRVISAIELSGDENVRQITLIEASGDQTAISFTQFQTGESALQPEELRAFGMGRGGFEF